MTRMKIRLSRPSDATIGCGLVATTIVPITKGASASASNGNSVTPSRIRNSSVPARTAAIGAAINAATVKPCGFRTHGAQPDHKGDQRQRHLSRRPSGQDEEAGRQHQIGRGSQPRRRRDGARSIKRRPPRPIELVTGLQRGEPFANLGDSLKKLARGRGKCR